MGDSQWLIWVGIALVLGIIEITTLDLVFLMLAGGALAAAGVSAADQGITLQVVVFSLVSVALLLGVRPAAKRFMLERQPEASVTGTAALVNRAAEVVTPIADGTGRVKLAGEIWTARLAPSTGLSGLGAGEAVRVVAIDGATAVVEPLPPGAGPVRLEPETPAN